MYLRRTQRAMRPVASATGRVVPLFSSATGVVMGESHTIERAWSPGLCVSRSGLPIVSSGLFAETFTLDMPRAVVRGRSPRTFGSCEAHGVGVSTAYTYGRSFDVRKAPVRWTKRWQRFNPGRCHDCDLRFSFPRSRMLPFSSRDARVEMGRSVMTD